jgi:ribosome-associated protein
MADIPLQGDHITLAQAVKAVGLAGSGGQAKHLVRSGAIMVNGQVETQPGRKLHAGDTIQAGEAGGWVISKPT